MSEGKTILVCPFCRTEVPERQYCEGAYSELGHPAIVSGIEVNVHSDGRWYAGADERLAEAKWRYSQIGLV